MVSIIIVAWQVKDLLKKCLESILTYEKKFSLEIVVIDNNSNDGTDGLIKNNFSQIKYFKFDKNYGFGYACNQGAKLAQGDYLLFLNPDTQWFEPILEKIHNFYQAKENIGAVGIKILNADLTVQKWVRNFPTLGSQIIILSKLHRLFKKLIENYLATNFNYQETASVDQVIGACLFIKKNLFEKIGKIDEIFFIWFEEVDLCQRLSQAGFHNYYFNEAGIIHRGEASFGQLTNLKKQLIFNDSLLYYFKKHHSLIEYLILWLFIPLNIALTSIIQLLRLKTKHYL